MAERSIASHKISFEEDQIQEILAGTEEILRSGQVILGDATRKFEQEYAEKCGRRFGVAMGSDTAAFEAQLKTLGGGVDGSLNGGYVLYPALAFPSILESVKNAGGQPWFVDGSMDGHLFSTLSQIQNATWDCQEQTDQMPKALILMHSAGLVARDAPEITEWCEAQGIAVLEDAAHSFGAEVKGRKSGSFGLSSAFSLYATKSIHACEGGMIVTDDEDLAEELRIYRNYGRTQDFGRSVIIRHGYSWRITEWQSLVGSSNLARMDKNIARRREIMDMYDELAVGGVWDRIDKLNLDDTMKPNGYRYSRLLPLGSSADDRLKLKEIVKTETGVDLPGETYERACHKQPVWEQYSHLSMPMAEEFCDRQICLPVYPTLTDDDVKYVVDRVGAVFEKSL